MEDETIAVYLHIYDLTRGMAQLMSAAILGKQIDGIWHTGVVVYGREYFFGGQGITSCLPGETILGQPNQIHPLGATQIPFSIFVDYVQGLADSTFRPDAYDLLQHNCNTFSNEIAQFLCGNSIPQHILDLPTEVLSTPFGQSLQPLLNSLGASSSQGGIPVLPLDLDGGRRSVNRAPSPGAVALERAIEDARRDSLKLEERRNTILEKVEKLEKKKAKKQLQQERNASSSSSSSVPEKKMADASEANSALDGSEETPKAPREPPIVYKDLIDVKKEYESLAECIAKVGQDDDHQSMSELKQYVIDDEGSWALGDNFLLFIAKWLNDDKPSNDQLRVQLLTVLAAAALKDDVILILHQDRRDHVLMNYAHNIDRLPLSEQQALALFMCNLFENGSSSEWLLYISEWTAPHTTSPLSNIRVTTKVAVTALLSDNPLLQDRGSAIIYNLAIKEVKTVVFDDVATELAMAILQFFSVEHSEEQIFRCMKGLVRFAYIAHSEVPALIKMIGPDPTQFKGMSARIDDLVEPLLDRLRSVRGMD
ncbi:uncharacterized protein LOC124197205 isoform X2 [Daphnia pulex]|uniref:uncharacterized protein LOC124197205 isoform X2 n=1 Tax=Daphnia pulex TaxID=6669 RepID=UPI001EDF6DA7|nr:uncharacterized protein LOC124197205 isoform X2 [Daphnia pulex]XP_046640739.1 uncharacterized protein LOC124326128 isoform X2 [Daphnia pulicaria]